MTVVEMAAVRAAVRGATGLHVGRVLIGLLLGSVLALADAVWLGGVRLKVDVAGSIIAQGLVTALFVLSAWDLVVRWRLVATLPAPLVTAWNEPRRVLRHVWPGLVLLLGIAVGHWFW
jgi:hypothetical protein